MSNAEIKSEWTSRMGMFSVESGWELAKALSDFIESHPPYVQFNTDRHYLSEDSAYQAFLRFAIKANPEFDREGKMSEIDDTDVRDNILSLLESSDRTKSFVKLVKKFRVTQ